MRLFADDTLIYSTSESCNDAAKLQSDLTALQEWAQKWQMKFNPSKCHVLRISRKQNPVESNYVLMGKVLDSVTHHPCLGVEMSRNLDWGQHVNNSHERQSITRISPAKLEQLPRGSERGSLRQLSLGPTVQRRAARFLENCYTRGTRNSYKPLERIKLDTPEGTKNNLAVNLIPQSNSW